MAGPSNDQPGLAAGGNATGIITRGRIGLAALALVLLVLAAAAGHWLGAASGEDLDAAREAGERAGWDQGTAIGGDIYPAGLELGRKITYGRTFRSSYRDAYERAFVGTGVDGPGSGEIEVPAP
ncbi:MAG TPA: hypothetical protein VFH44_02575 [Solirubrobacterales bacterium]|nr:hypothetical protein [Solirubrobacterales bacterium]